MRLNHVGPLSLHFALSLLPIALADPAFAVTVEARSAYASPGESVEVRVHIRTMGTRVDHVEYDLSAGGIAIEANDCDRGEAIPEGGVHVSRTRIGGFADDTLLQTCVVQLPDEVGIFPLILANAAANGAGNTPLEIATVAGEIGAVLETPTATPTPTPGTVTPACGNFDREFGEECDDGNSVGADGCAANCTNESQAPFVFSSGHCEGGDTPGAVCDIDANCGSGGICSGVRTIASAQGRFLQLDLGLHGTQTVRIGRARDGDVIDKNGALLTRKGEVPVAFNLPDSQIDAIPIPPFACACVRFFGLGTVAARGVIACDEAGLEGVDYDLTTNHDAGDINPMCIDGVREQPSGRHPNACNVIPVTPEFSGSGPRGSAILETGLAISLFADGGRCCHAGVDPDCEDPFFEKGFDGIPCNEDDFSGEITRIYLTTGTARTSIENADATAGTRIATGSKQPCTASDQCPQSDETCTELETLGECDEQSAECECRVFCGTRPCVSENTGQPFDCDALAAGGPDRFAGGVLVSASVLFDTIIGDNAIISTLVDQSSAGDTPVPTVTPTETASASPTATFTPTPFIEPSQTATFADTATPTTTPTPSETATLPSRTPTQTPTEPPVSCPGDCDGGGDVTVDEIVTAVNIALGTVSLPQCLAADDDGDGSVTVDELVRAVTAALNGCG